MSKSTSWSFARVALTGFVGLFVSATTLVAQQGGPGAQGGQQPPQGGQQQGPAGGGPGGAGGPGGGGGGGGGQPRTQPYVAGDTAGFTRIFDGTLRNWDGDPTFWRADSMMIRGESTPEKVVQRNNFLIWRGGILRDFELKLEVRMTGTNSGIQIRSRQLPDSVGRWVLAGYQMDMDFNNTYPGNIFEERGRGFMAPRGEVTHLETTGQRPKIIGTTGSALEMRGVWNTNGWNQYHIIARGPTIILIVNGRLTAVFIDDDLTNRALEGLLGFQMHTGPPFKVDFRNIFLKNLQ